MPLSTMLGPITDPLPFYTAHCPLCPSLALLQAQFHPTSSAPLQVLIALLITEDHHSQGPGCWLAVVSLLKPDPWGPLGFQVTLAVKNPSANAGDIRFEGSIPGLGRSPGEHGNQLQYSCLENPHGQRSLAGCSPWRSKQSNKTKAT